MSAIDKKTDELFMVATLSDDSLGYPDDVAFVPGDQDWAMRWCGETWPMRVAPPSLWTMRPS